MIFSGAALLAVDEASETSTLVRIAYEMQRQLALFPRVFLSESDYSILRDALGNDLYRHWSSYTAKGVCTYYFNVGDAKLVAGLLIDRVAQTVAEKLCA